MTDARPCLFESCRGPRQGKKVCGNSFADVRVCPDCGVQRLDPPRTQEQLNALHADPAYFEHPYFTARRSAGDGQRRESYRAIVREIFPEGVPQGARLLDVGCDTGAFLQVARDDFGLSVAGVEISPVSAKVAREKGFDIYVGNIMALDIRERFDAIVINDVIEHVERPDDLVRILAGLLKPGGRLFISTPNADALIYVIGSVLYRLFGRMPLLDKLYLPYHEWYFPVKTLENLVLSKGLDVASHRSKEFPLSEFGHGNLLKIVMGVVFMLQALTRRPSVQFMVAQKKG